ncbi:permease [Thalassospira alkalitolerans]|uniref:permease n=1 Tax=Thalassospira alkalitolerans TaxID=1293890 RepID=UPI003AA85997
MLATLRTLYRENPREGHLAALILLGFLAIYFIPAGTERFDNAILEAVRLTNWYAREHVILCLLPAFVIAGAMAVYISQGSVMQYLGPDASRPIALGVASISGTLLAVCSCTVLPLFGGIYKRGAGLGPAIAFLYSGPAINIIAIVVTAKILGAEIGIARGVGAIVFAVVIGLIMHLIYRREEAARAKTSARGFAPTDAEKPLGTTVTFFALMIAVLVFANWAPVESPVWMMIFTYKWLITALLATGLAVVLIRKFDWPRFQVLMLALAVILACLVAPNAPELAFAIGIGGMMMIALSRPQDREWADQSWDFTKQILPLLVIGVFVAGLLLGRPGHEGLIPARWVNAAVGDNSLQSTILASVLGAFMYFSTLTEVPIVQALMGAGMGKGPALSLLLAGPALSLPNMLVIRTVIGTEKTVVYCSLVIVMATVTGFIYGNYW